MKIGRVMAASKSYKSIYIVFFLYLAQANSASVGSSSRCGCIEKDKLSTLTSISSMVLGPSHSDTQTTKCNIFCSTKSGTRFVNVEQGICHCFKTSQLATFDCDEVLRSSDRESSAAVIPVYCVSSSYIQHLKLSSSSSNKPLAAKRKSGTTNSSSEDKIDVQEEESQFTISQGIASAAIVLVTLSVVVLILFGVKTWYDNKKRVKGQEESDKCPKENTSSWNFSEDKIKETRFENNV